MRSPERVIAIVTAALVGFLGGLFLGNWSTLSAPPGHVQATAPPPVILGNPLPNSTLTPGALNPAVTQANIHQTICVPGYSTKIRPAEHITNRLKRQIMAQYGYSSYPLADFELDHLISLEIGGAPADPHNLWPEPYEKARIIPKGYGSETKDRFEDYLHRQVCAGTMMLRTAQLDLQFNWRLYMVEDGLNP